MYWRDLESPLVVIVGPTAVGKTDVAISLAEQMGGEIVSADSRLFYRGMDIGTAKPTPDEMAKIPHHLIDVTTPDKPWSLAIFQAAAKSTISEIHRRRKLPFLVGGTGQYIQAVIDNWNIPVQEPDLRLRDALESWGRQVGAEVLHQKLLLIDPQSAAKIEPRNLRRTVRALEVIFHSGRKFSVQRQKGKTIYQICWIGLSRPRQELYQRIDVRIDQMIQKGLLGEVHDLLNQGYSEDLPPFSAIGYREMVQVLRGEISMEMAGILMKRFTRRFVRRQANWFKLDNPSIKWFDLSQCDIQAIARHIANESAWVR